MMGATRIGELHRTAEVLCDIAGRDGHTTKRKVADMIHMLMATNRTAADDRDTWKRIAQCDPFRKIWMDDDMCRAFARELDIQADGGDDPAVFVKHTAQQLGFVDGPSIKGAWRG